jgi:peroxiredoxin
VQLVELQEAWPTLQQMGVALFAVSYDDVAILAAFAEKHEITYPLLSDEGSVTIRSLGLLNEHLEQQHAVYGIVTRDEQHGVAYPGTFALDEQGLIRNKHFEQSYRVRPTRSIILEWAGSGGIPSPGVTRFAASDAIDVRAWTDEPTYRPYQQLRLHVRLAPPLGVHVYAAPVPQGYQALSVELEPLDGLAVGELVLPAARPFIVAGLDESFVVCEGTVDLTLPFMLTRNLGATTLGVRVRYQACTDATCFPPARASLEIALSGLELIRD